MRKFIVFLVLFVFLACPTPSFAAQKDPNVQTWFNKTTDYFATIGKSDEEKRELIRLRKEARRKYRLEQNQYERKQEIRKKMEKQNAAIMRKIKAGEER